MMFSNSSEVGDHSRYRFPTTTCFFYCYHRQYLITLGFFPFNFFLGYVYLSPILTLFPPPHWCAVPALSHLSREERKELAIPRLKEEVSCTWKVKVLHRTETGGYEQCSQYVVDWNLILNGTKPLNQVVGELLGLAGVIVFFDRPAHQPAASTGRPSSRRHRVKGRRIFIRPNGSSRR